MLPDPNKVHELLRVVAQEELLPRLATVERCLKDDGSLLTEADLAVNARLGKALARDWPGIDLLTEEAPPDKQQALLHPPRSLLWCLDPLDGTSNFAAGLLFFAVSLALMEKGRAVLGIIYDPIRDESFIAEQGQGATCNGNPLVLEPTDVSLDCALALVNLKHLEPQLASRLVHTPPYGSQRSYGACALELAWLAAGRGHIALYGRPKIWDVAAGSLILREAGGMCSTLGGQEPSNRIGAREPMIAARDSYLFAEWRDWLNGG
uniref:Myo-inositol-1(Or 4)-monophosphatase n=1 Tax=Candidatus Kentrum sp. MB TaxID=2138164 RepID=A0A450XQE1_9GAMM|nr:MAG: myo-inositol-1(or 4)-monophosphatase [Candidatus Kentron sp. MB]